MALDGEELQIFTSEKLDATIFCWSIIDWSFEHKTDDFEKEKNCR